MIKITYTPPSYAKLLQWKLATSNNPQNKYSFQFRNLSLVFPSNETWSKEKNIKTHAQEKLFSSMMKKAKKKEGERKNIWTCSQNKFQRERDHTTRSTNFHIIHFPHTCTS
jgi:hypothetical protein